MDKKILRQIVKDNSPWAKVSTNTNIFKAWAASMAVGLYSVGCTKEEIIDFLLDSKYGFDQKHIESLVEFITKSPTLDQRPSRALKRKKAPEEQTEDTPEDS